MWICIFYKKKKKQHPFFQHSVYGSPLHDVAVGGKLKRNKVIRVGVLREDEKHGIKSGEESLKGVVGLMRLFQRNRFGFGFFELMRL